MRKILKKILLTIMFLAASIISAKDAFTYYNKPNSESWRYSIVSEEKCNENYSDVISTYDYSEHEKSDMKEADTEKFDIEEYEDEQEMDGLDSYFEDFEEDDGEYHDEEFDEDFYNFDEEFEEVYDWDEECDWDEIYDWDEEYDWDEAYDWDEEYDWDEAYDWDEEYDCEDDYVDYEYDDDYDYNCEWEDLEDLNEDEKIEGINDGRYLDDEQEEKDVFAVMFIKDAERNPKNLNIDIIGFGNKGEEIKVLEKNGEVMFYDLEDNYLGKYSEEEKPVVYIHNEKGYYAFSIYVNPTAEDMSNADLFGVEVKIYKNGELFESLSLDEDIQYKNRYSTGVWAWEFAIDNGSITYVR